MIGRWGETRLLLLPTSPSPYLFNNDHSDEPLLMRIAHAIHYPVLQFSMHHKSAVIAFAAAVLVVTYGMIAPNLGSEFVPRLSEGSLVLGLVRMPGTDLEESVRGNTVLEKLLLEKFPDEVAHVWSREWGQRCLNITCNVRGRDLGSFVAEVQKKIAEDVKLPSGRYRIEYGGQFENLIRAERRLMIVVPIALALIFMLLYFTYHNFVDAARVFTGVPFAWVGGIIALWLRDMPFSISAGIAMSGVAVLDDMILVSYVRQLRERGLSLDNAVTQAAITRLRPVLMTTLVAALGFLPMAFSIGMGAEVQRPLATVVIGGVIGAMIMSLLVLRVLYMIFNSAFERHPAPNRGGEVG